MESMQESSGVGERGSYALAVLSKLGLKSVGQKLAALSLALAALLSLVVFVCVYLGFDNSAQQGSIAGVNAIGVGVLSLAGMLTLSAIFAKGIRSSEERLRNLVAERHQSDSLHSALYRIAEMTSSAEDLPAFYSAVHQIVEGLMYAENFFIAVYDHSTELVSFPCFVDVVDIAPQPRKLKRGMTEYVLRTGQPLLASRETIEPLATRG
ncbi:MAG TPA: hypothetical protein VE977_17175, partial [Pyrinomonadaceae bacterium]|nr:hypothetical protein [Pyrinomonadaceae bacterium]